MFSWTEVEQLKPGLLCLLRSSLKKRTVQFCNNYLRLNTVAVRESYSLYVLEKFIDTLEDATVRSTLDARTDSWKSEVDEGDWEKLLLLRITAYTNSPRFRLVSERLYNIPMSKGYYNAPRLMTVWSGISW